MKKTYCNVKTKIKRLTSAGLAVAVAATLTFGTPMAKAAAGQYLDKTNTKFENTKFYKADSPANKLFGVAGSFHIFASDEINLTKHCNGNFASPKGVQCDTNFGTKQAAESGEPELVYISKNSTYSKLDVMSSVIAFDESMDLYEGDTKLLPGSTISGGQATLKSGDTNVSRIDGASAKEMWKVGSNFIDFDKEFKYLRKLSKKMVDELEPTALTANNHNYTDMNQPYFSADEGVNVVNLTGSDLQRFNNTFQIKNVECNRGTGKNHTISNKQSVIINVDCAGKDSWNFNFSSNSVCVDGVIGNGEENYYTGSNVIWNIYDSSKPDKLYNGSVSFAKVVNGCFLAPNATLTLTSNSNGTLIAKSVNPGSESHRSDFGGRVPTFTDDSEKEPSSTTSEEKNTPSTPSENTPSTPSEDTPSTPGTDTPNTPSTPSKDTPSTPGTDTPNTPSTPSEDTPSVPGTDTPNTPSTPSEDTPSTPGTDTPSTPSENTPSTPGTDTPNTPSTPSKDIPNTPDEDRPTTPTTENKTSVDTNSTVTTETTTTATEATTETSNTETGTLVITVTDEETGENVPKAKIEVESPNGTTTTHVTDQSGTVTIPNTPTGTYSVTITDVPSGYHVTKGKKFTTTVSSNKVTKKKVKVDTPKSNKDKKNARKALKHAADVKTGDSFNLAIPVTIMLLSLMGMIAMLMAKKKETSNK